MKCKTVISKLLVLVFTFSLIISASSANKVYADAFKVVTLGADLTNEQKEEMLKYFGVTRKEANVMEVNKEEEDKYLAGVATRKQIGTKSISCAYVEPTDKGGLNISTHNIYWVTENMIRNALITAGVENANVKVGAPFNVSGTAALTGILKGFESSKGGKKIDEEKKKVANEEMVVTGNLGEKIGQDEAANLINEVKKEVVKEKPKTEKEIKNIVKDATNNYGYKLSDEDMQKITALMDKINGLDLDFKQIKDQLNQVSNKLKDVVTSEEAKGFFSKLWEGIKDFFDNIFSSNKEEKTTSYNVTKVQNITYNKLRI
ncbi:DUF1002 domain-containing protein [Clostridium botulinum]|uniref:Exported protein n=5 Tax=Clostridium botulinum TaxID=1491 RepID=A5I2N0_CLOBH|nr:DUF1002 domain-containing protein [Clostridium botulinum]AJD25666.1 hypothetical protein T257_21 [Clostridium botulinum CDC_297]ABS33291.1 conserved hypothetical protein [Clostridium botulinum A str. ATCC 19397]ABS36249.1 conserved hypothetical protein [Clostridium botulinum A str. Hall]ACA44797.1 conserved hypothetical protein [Clostridium botulinum B1 str. Okra]ACA56919.1 conserved hypothetical protein [Clostridium botulinum A3 str. Loch Maree]